MTDYFEVHERDGAARVATLRLADPVTTPALVDERDLEEPGGARVLADAGSLWPEERGMPDGTEEALTVLPHRSFPAGTDAAVQEAFAVDYPDVPYPSAAVVTPETATDHGTDAYVLSTAPGVVGHASAFVEAVVAVREAIPDDTALCLSGVATPANVATLAYAGVDLVDGSLARIRGRQGRYLTTEGDYRLEELEELPGAFPSDPPLADFTREDCVEHNVAALRAELATVRNRVRRGRLRDYLEGQARHEQWQTATLRELDDQYAYLEQRTPVWRDAELAAATEDTLHRVEIQRFADRVTTRYRNRFDNPLVLVPCSARKPYSDSQSHGQFHRSIQFRGHVVSMTSPIAVVPQELELTYPAQQYDTVVTGRWTEGEKTFVAEVLRRYLTRNDYPRVVAHVPEGGYRDVCERALAGFDGPIEYTVADHPTTDESLAALADALEGEAKYRKRERQHNTVRAVADWQFGGHDGERAAGDVLFPEIRTTGRYPQLQVRDSDGTQLAALVPKYGTLSLTLAGARRWVESGLSEHRVEIDGFVPHGSVLAPGILDADDAIRVGDEVVVEGPAAFAVGRAAMPGPAMRESTRGVAVDVRHVEER